MSELLVQQVLLAAQTQRAADKAYLCAVEVCYPVGSTLGFHERRGSIVAEVIAHGLSGELIVRNVKTNKQRRFCAVSGGLEIEILSRGPQP